jgi:hypothetical protein
MLINLVTKKAYRKHFSLIFLTLIFLLPLLSLLHPGLPLTHDGRDHVARIANFHQSLSEGNLIPRWAGNLNWGYGHPILMFLYPFPSYFTSLFLFIGIPLVSAVKLIFGLSFALSGLFMYLWLQEFLDQKAAFTGAVLYTFAPYRFVDLYVRGAIGECWAFVWPPLILWFALKLSKKFRWIYVVGGALSVAFMILSHNALSLMFFLLIFSYFAYLAFTSRKKFLITIYYLLISILGFCLSAFFWIPAFLEGKYTLRDIVTAGNITGFEPLSRLLFSDWSFGGTGSLSVQVGLLQWLAIFISPLLVYRLRKQKNNLWLFAVILVLLFCVAIVFMLPFARPLYLKISLLQKFQFAWRWLSLAILPPALLGALVIFISPRKYRLSLTLIVVVLSLMLTYNQWKPRDYLLKNESFYTQVFPGTTDTGESAPRWSVRFMEKFPPASIVVIGGEAEIEEKARSTNRHHYRIATSKGAQILENTLYFPSWTLMVDGVPAPIEYQDPNHHGVMTFILGPGHHDVVLEFRETKLRRLANGVSLLSLAFLFLGPLGISLAKKRQNNRTMEQ